MRHGPLESDVQGLADAFILMGYAFDSPEARNSIKKFFEDDILRRFIGICTLAEETRYLSKHIKVTHQRRHSAV
jgi:ribonucleoside-diphosphate reductase subunit M1